MLGNKKIEIWRDLEIVNTIDAGKLSIRTPKTREVLDEPYCPRELVTS